MTLFVGVDPGVKHGAWAVVDERGRCLLIKTLDDEPALLVLHAYIAHNARDIGCVCVEWPNPRGDRPASGRDFDRLRSCAERVARMADDAGIAVLKVGDAAIRFNVCGYSPRRDGCADRFVRAWLKAKLMAAGREDAEVERLLRHAYSGTHRRDALMAALYARKLSVVSCQLSVKTKSEVQSERA